MIGRTRRPSSKLVFLALWTLFPLPSIAAEEKIEIQGVKDRVEIRTDRWGVAHIEAKNEHDLFFAQGFSVARDRLFQLELWRRQATGTLAEILGPRALEADRGARLSRYRGDLESELRHYHPHGPAIVQAFVDGINEFIDRALKTPEHLPLEFKVLGITPGRWTPEVVISRHNGLSRNATSEISTAALVKATSPAVAEELLNLRPGRPSLELDPTLVDLPFEKSMLGPYAAARSPVSFVPEDIRPEYRRTGVKESKEDDHQTFESHDRSGLIQDLFDSGAVDDGSSEGSNNWAISSDRTFMRAPLLANDPHRAIQVPSLRYWVHLKAPGWNVIGAGEPALPGVAIGHNERGAWGITIFPADQEDLFVLETHPDDPSKYRQGDDWVSMTESRESVAVKGKESVEVTLKFSRYGPILSEDPKRHRAVALRAAWLEQGTAPYLASLRLDQAANWEEFRVACQACRTPSLNMVWADRDGHIGWQASGIVPIRRKGNGLVPVPGNGSHDWEGFLPPFDLPHELDPARGWVASANQENLPLGYPFPISYQWADPYRQSRVEEVLDSPRRFTMTDMMRLQHDELSIPARSLFPLLLSVVEKRHEEFSELESMIKRMREWDYVLEHRSPVAALYVAWEREIRKEVWKRVVPVEARKLLGADTLSIEKITAWLLSPDGRFGSNPIKGRDQAVYDAFEAASTQQNRSQGDRFDAWRYGGPGQKRSEPSHPLEKLVTEELRLKLRPGFTPRGGSSHTVNSTSDSANQATGASFRIISDLGDWDRSVGTNMPGQSGNPVSPHYRDLFPGWATGSYFPVFFTQGKVESVTEAHTTLQPAR